MCIFFESKFPELNLNNIPITLTLQFAICVSIQPSFIERDELLTHASQKKEQKTHSSLLPNKKK